MTYTQDCSSVNLYQNYIGWKEKELPGMYQRQRYIKKVYRETEIHQSWKKTLGNPKSTTCSIMKNIEETGQVENRQGWGRKKMFMDKFKNKLSHVVGENRRKLTKT